MNLKFLNLNRKIISFLLAVNSEISNSTLLNSEIPNSDKSHISEKTIQIPYFGTYQTQIPYKKKKKPKKSC